MFVGYRVGHSPPLLYYELLIQFTNFDVPISTAVVDVVCVAYVRTCVWNSVCVVCVHVCGYVGSLSSTLVSISVCPAVTAFTRRIQLINHVIVLLFNQLFKECT